MIFGFVMICNTATLNCFSVDEKFPSMEMCETVNEVFIDTLDPNLLVIGQGCYNYGEAA